MIHRFLPYLASLFLVLASSASAQVPWTINYQGRLLNSSGAPVPDGSYSVVFRFWDNETASAPGNLIWTSGAVSVVVADGIFSTLLEIQDPDYFSYPEVWIGVQVLPDPEATPRRRVVSTPYALDSYHAGFAENTNDLWLNQSGDVLLGQLGVSDSTHNRLLISPIDPQLIAYDLNGMARWQLFSGVWTEEDMASRNGTAAYSLTSWPYSGGEHGGEIILYDEQADAKIVLNGALPDDGAVQLPQGAINSDEMLNEPGLASNGIGALGGLPINMAVLVSVDITIPADGYIYLDARCGFGVNGGSGAVGGFFLITDDPNEAGGFPDLVEAFLLPESYVPIYCSRAYYKAAGTYTFYLVGSAAPVPPATTSYYDPVLTAQYFPTAYGPIHRVVSSQEAGQFSNRETVQTRKTNEGATQSGYKVDLRELELKAARARAEAAHAENELLKAKIAERREQLKK